MDFDKLKQAVAKAKSTLSSAKVQFEEDVSEMEEQFRQQFLAASSSTKSKMAKVSVQLNSQRNHLTQNLLRHLSLEKVAYPYRSMRPP